MKRPAVFFDRDNTLIIGNDYIGDPDDVVLMQGAADAISRTRALGYATVVISNQSGVARGMFTEADVRAVNTRLEDYLLEENPNAVIDRQEYCPFHPDGAVEKYRRDSDLRKPKPGMLLKAADLLKLDLTQSWVIGDAPRDIEAGQAAGCKTILFHPPEIDPSPAAAQESNIKPDFTCTTLKDAIDYISTHGPEEPHQPTPPSPITPPPPIAPPEQSTSSPLDFDPERGRRAVSQINPPSPAQIDPPPPTQINQLDPRALHHLERLSEQILEELKRRHDHRPDFSVSKLMGGITQILSIAILFVAYLNRANPDVMFPMIFTAIFCQLLTIALLIMDHQR